MKLTKRIPQLLLFRKSVKNGTIIEREIEGQRIWFISPTAPDKVKALGPELKKMEIDLFALTCLAEFIAVVFGIGIFLKALGLI
jgi:hypothetical protein